jgi:hypothetical protein
MIVLRQRDNIWYADKQRILNSEDLVDFDKAIISPESSPIFDSEADRYCIIENYNEMVEELRNMYAAFMTFYSSFREETGIIWLNYDCQIKGFELYRTDPKQVFLGKWKWNFKDQINGSVEQLCKRYLVIRPEWYEEARKSLLKTGHMTRELS